MTTSLTHNQGIPRLILCLCIWFLFYTDAAADAVLKDAGSNAFAYDIRAIQIQLYKSTGAKSDPIKQSLADIVRLIEKTSGLGFNVLILDFEGGTARLTRTPQLANQWAYTVDDLQKISTAARSAGMDVIPALPLLTHQKNIIGRIDKSLMLNEGDYDPDKPRVYEIIFTIMDELIDIFQPRFFLIGHDEVFGAQDRQRTIQLTPKHFLADILKINAFLEKRGIRPIMWADMLLDGKIYQTMYDRSGVYGDSDYAMIIDQLPKNIILCDWHYRSLTTSFPSYTYLQNKGFLVWGAVWQDADTISAFSRFVSRHARKGEGMVLTTWWPFVTQETAVIDRSIEEFSKTFYSPQ